MKKYRNDDTSWLKDGQSRRIPMTMRDGKTNTGLSQLQRAVAANVTVGDGERGILNLNKPGFRIAVGDTAAFDAKETARQARDEAMRNAWKHPVRDDNGDADDDNYVGLEEGDICSESDARPRDRIARDRRQHLRGRDQRQQALEARDREMAQAWRNPK